MSDAAREDRRPGRPPGQELVALRGQGLCLHDLALLRAVVQGMKPAAAARRYLPELTADERIVRSYLADVTRQARVQLEALGESGAAEALATMTQTDPDGAHGQPSAVPSLEEFAESLPEDMYGERELIALYQAQYGSQATGQGARPGQRAALEQRALSGLVLIQSSAVKAPAGADGLGLWLSQRLCHRLRPFGVLRLQELVGFINGSGRNWFRQVPGLGRDRAGRLVQWLVDHEAHIGLGLSVRVKGALGPTLECPPQYGPVLVQQSVGAFSLRSGSSNALGANSDRQAVQAWLATLELKSPHTRRAYLRDVERLLLWAREQSRALSTLTVEDAIAHVRFLLAPPAHWVTRLPTRRSMADWRPMRGPMSASSANRALAAIGHLYGFLVESGYLLANPFARVRSVGGAKAPHQRMDTTRSFSDEHLQEIGRALAAMPEGAAKRRLAAILMLAETTGLRRDELARHAWGDVKPVPGHGEARVQGLTVRGKGGVERIVPLRPAVLEALRKHREDRATLVEQGLIEDVAETAVPLISIIDAAPQLGHGVGDGGLSEAGLHRVLKGLFGAVAKQCEDEHLQEDFRRASAHWLRHTFAHEVLKASGNDLPVTQQLLGHKNISTTGIYLKADLTQRVDAVMALPERFVEGS